MKMWWLIWIPLILVGIFWLARHFDRKRQPEKKANPFDGEHNLPYERRPIMSETELQVYDLLLKSLPEYMIFPQVQVSRVIESPQENNLYWFNFINRLSYDFVICRTDGTPIVAIEIDDASHAQPSRQEADKRKDLATTAAGMAMLRWAVDEVPSSAEITSQIRQLDRDW